MWRKIQDFFDLFSPPGAGEGEKLLIRGFVLEQLCANELITGSQEPEPLINPQHELQRWILCCSKQLRGGWWGISFGWMIPELPGMPGLPSPDHRAALPNLKDSFPGKSLHLGKGKRGMSTNPDVQSPLDWRSCSLLVFPVLGAGIRHWIPLNPRWIQHISNDRALKPVQSKGNFVVNPWKKFLFSLFFS